MSGPGKPRSGRACMAPPARRRFGRRRTRAEPSRIDDDGLSDKGEPTTTSLRLLNNTSLAPAGTMTSGPVDVDAAVEPLFTPSFFDLDRLVADEANGSQGSLPDILQPPAAASSFSTTLGLEIDYVFAPIAGPSTYWPPGPPPLLPSTLGNAPPTTTGVPSKWPATLYMPSAEVTRPQQNSAASPACAWAGDPPRSSMAGVLAESHTTPGGGQSLREWLRTQGRPFLRL
jgi:hypothetical protein